LSEVACTLLRIVSNRHEVVWSVTSSHRGRRRIVSLGRIRNAGLFQLAEASHISASLVPQSV